MLRQRGWFSLIQTAGRRFWVASTEIHTTAFRHDGRNLVDGCDAVTWS